MRSEDIKVSEYFEWEEAVVEQVATALDEAIRLRQPS